MRILHLSTFHTTGGAGIAARRLNEALVRNGLDSQLLVPQTDRPEPQVTGLAETPLQRKTALARFALDRLSFWLHERDKTVRFAFSPARVGSDLSRHPLVQQADVLHLHWTQFGFLSLDGMRKLFSLGKPVVWTLHDMWAFTGGCHYSGTCERYRTHCQHCPFLRRPAEHDLSYRVFERKKAVFANVPLTFVTPSRWLSDLLKTSALAGGFPVEVLPNPIDTKRFQPSPDRADIRRQLNLPVDRRLLLFGSFNTADPRKGFRYVQEALRKAKNNLPDTELMVFGKTGPETDAALPLPVHSLGSVSSEEQMIRIYQAADAFVIPSLEDNFPNTVIESLACGTPVVGFATGGIPEQITHLRTGYLAEPKSSDDLAAGLIWLLNETDPAMVRTQAADSVKPLDYAVMAERFGSLYRRTGGNGAV
ncbi:glycosyltransferase family 4 protein [Larkinella soli]|uniref:glycosyltransferase family 4 protein n=1 Tax=Larkinella soli TaxID=1770527 RepID=UPI000FFC58A8|nr:glycosyltransferase family 4 protein [Larkinella soli]